MNKTDLSDLSAKRLITHFEVLSSSIPSALDLFKELRSKQINPINPINTLAKEEAPLSHAVGLPPVYARQRWGLWPSTEIRLTGECPFLSTDAARLVTEYISRQSVEATSWIEKQAAKYAAMRPTWKSELHKLAACLDCALWQLAGHLDGATRGEQVASLVSMLSGLDEIVDHFDRVQGKQVNS